MPNPRIEPLKKVLAIDPNDEVAWFGLGKAYMEDNNWQEAVPALQSCITVKPTYSAAFYALAQSLLKLGRFDECRQVSDQGIACLHKKRRRDGDKKPGSVEKHATYVIGALFYATSSMTVSPSQQSVILRAVRRHGSRNPTRQCL